MGQPMAPKKKAAAAAAAPEPAPVEDDVSMGDAPAAAEEGAAQEDDTVSVFDEEQRIRILPGATLDACTFAIHNEDHTLGNALRYIIMKDPDVEFCGYSAPHPSEPVIHLRVQMHDNKSAKEAVTKGLDRLEVIFSSIGDAYKEDLAKGEYERYEPKVMNMEAVRKLAEGDEDDNATANQDTTMQ